MSSANSHHWRMQLNNYLQTSIGRQALTWEVTATGPQHALVWQAVAYINNVEYGRGVAATQNAAKELAAQQALQALYSSRR